MNKCTYPTLPADSTPQTLTHTVYHSSICTLGGHRGSGAVSCGEHWRLHDWLSSQAEVWAVLNGHPRASKVAKGVGADISRPVTGRKSLSSPGVEECSQQALNIAVGLLQEWMCSGLAHALVSCSARALVPGSACVLVPCSARELVPDSACMLVPNSQGEVASC